MQISVIIPTHNRVHCLPGALRSVLAQTLAPAEVIVVDDGSTDATHELMRSSFPDCRYLYQRNAGVSAARNRGIAAARGDWIALLDSDDEWLPGKLAAQLQVLAANPERRVCHTEELWIRNGTRVNAMQKHAKSGGDIFLRCLPRCVISPSSVLLHRGLLAQVGLFDETLPVCEDYDLWLRICARERVAYVAKPQIIKHGGHPDQLSRRHWGMDRFRVRALEKLLSGEALSRPQRAATVKQLIEKAGILAAGAEKRGYRNRATHYRSKQAHYRRRLACAVDTPLAE